MVRGSKGGMGIEFVGAVLVVPDGCGAVVVPGVVGFVPGFVGTVLGTGRCVCVGVVRTGSVCVFVLGVGSDGTTAVCGGCCVTIGSPPPSSLFINFWPRKRPPTTTPVMPIASSSMSPIEEPPERLFFCWLGRDPLSGSIGTVP